VYRQQSTAGDYLTMIQHALLLAGAAVGLRGRWRRAWPLAASVVAFSLLYMAVMAQVPYIVAVMPLLVALSAIACTEIGAQVRTGLRRGVGGSHPAATRVPRRAVGGPGNSPFL
jgi:hypothetical protein